MRVFLVSAYPTVRAGLRALVQEHTGWSVSGEASPSALRAEGAAQGGPDTAAVDVLLADLDASSPADQLATLIQVIQPHAGVVAIGATGGTTPDAAPPLAPGALTGPFAALGLGLLPRDATAEEIISAVDAVSHGLIVIDRGAALTSLLAAATPAPAPSAASQPAHADALPTIPGEPLTARELEVLQLLAEGLPNKLIAAQLHVSEHTAKFHVASIMTKLGAASRTEAVTLAARRGLLIF